MKRGYSMKYLKVTGIILLSILSLTSLLNLDFPHEATASNVGYITGQLLFLALCIFGIIKLSKSLKKTIN